VVVYLVETLRYKSERRGFFPDDVTVFFTLPNPSSRNTTLGSTQPLTEMSIKPRRLTILWTSWPITVIALPLQGRTVYENTVNSSKEHVL
jgi:hypothetical protein